MRILRKYNRLPFWPIGFLPLLSFVVASSFCYPVKEILKKDFKIPIIQFTDSLEGMEVIYKQLRIKDKEALIIKFFEREFMEKESQDRILVFENNGKVKLIETKTIGSLYNQKLEVKKVSRRKRETYWNFLDSLVLNNSIYLNRSELDSLSASVKKRKESDENHFVGGKRGCIILIQGNKILIQCLESYWATEDDPRRIKTILDFTSLYSRIENMYLDSRETKKK